MINVINETKWMGRYRGFIGELVRHSNITSKALSIKADMDGIMMTPAEWQVLEYVVEHRYDDDRMIHISDTLEIPQSTFSRTVKTLCAEGLIEKYQMSNNRKNIILKPSERGLEFYKSNYKKIIPEGFKQFFASLESISDEDLETVTNALRILNDSFKADFTDHANENKLVKME